MKLDSTRWEAFLERLYRQREFAIKLGLDPIRDALKREAHPHKTHRRILIAGSNGKGETGAFLAAILKAHGLKVGFFSSPHLIDLRERFRVDGQLLSPAEIYQIGDEVLRLYGQPDQARPALTFFELVTLIAARVFAENKVDVALYEVGLGGRLDATNALEPDLSIITGVSLDHTEYLGDTLAAVAAEKAGIFRPDRPAIIGRQGYPEALETLKTLAPAGAKFFAEDFDISPEGCIKIARAQGLAQLKWLPDQPATRRWNAACAAAAAAEFLGALFSPELALLGLSNARWPGRLDQRRLRAAGEAADYTYLFDAAHNPDAAQYLYKELSRRQAYIGAVVCASMRDKDLSGVYTAMLKDVPIFAATLDNERAARPEQIAAALGQKSLAASGPTDQMLERARRAIDRERAGRSADLPEPIILVFGSIYLLGECFQTLGVAPETLRTDISA